ncbi:MAG: 3-keto-5-aminohexanoate cleavage protein [Actinobacteria bacterium]|jgi:3-keto-5-aminohexanoate cleavage enzyme|nr:MAG: 3-keto-5-aminohexanoate cleavage protein [Actinomycetota bacterium]
MSRVFETPLIITATANTCWMHPGVEYPRTAQAIADEAALCLEKGAAVCHTHAEGRWDEVIPAIRQRCDIIIQCGMSSTTLEERADVFAHKGDMISVILGHHDEAFAAEDFNVLHTKEELISYARACADSGVVPEFEVWHSGSIWNLLFLVREGLLAEPYVTTLFFGWPGGTWSPPTIDEYLYRRRQMPEGCVCTVSVMGESQMKLLAAAMVEGDHIRVGTEDYPFNREGEVAPTHVLVEEARRIAEALGRPVATPQEARGRLGIGRRP